VNAARIALVQKCGNPPDSGIFKPLGGTAILQGTGWAGMAALGAFFVGSSWVSSRAPDRSAAFGAKGSTRALYRPRAGESLYAISNQFYGTPHQWRQIAEVNGLYGMTLTGEELLTIPAAAR
jgi:nucleoid-associated protein YgaU